MNPKIFTLVGYTIFLLSACSSGLAPTHTDTSMETPIQEPISVGDPERGQAIFPGEENLTGTACISCHSLDGSESPSISIQGVSMRTEDRQPGMSAEV